MGVGRQNAARGAEPEDVVTRGGKAECARTASGRDSASARECVHLGGPTVWRSTGPAVDRPVRRPASRPRASRAHRAERARAGGAAERGQVHHEEAR